MIPSLARRRAAALALAGLTCLTAAAAGDLPAEAAPSALLAQSCSGCHAADRSVETSIPRLTTLTSEQIRQAMLAFRDGSRGATVMNRLARGYSDEEIRWIAEQIGRH